MILTLITPGMNHSWHQEPQLEKIDNRVNPSLELRRSVKIYRIGSETLKGTHKACLIHSQVIKPRTQLGRFVGTISRTL
jgi:hypothetical protein